MLNALRRSPEPKRQALQSVSVAKDQAEGHALFEALVCAYHRTTLQIGAVTCCMNASVVLGGASMLKRCGNFASAEEPVVRVALRAWREIGIPKELAASIAKIYFDLAEAKNVTMPLIDRAHASSAPMVTTAKLEQIMALWRRLAEDCGEVAQDLEPLMQRRLNGLYTNNTLVLGTFIKEAVAGKYSCVNANGEIALPLLAQRRRTSRFMLLQPCKVSCRSSTSMAFAREISRSGIDIDCQRMFRSQEAVTVELSNGRKMKGHVVWCKAGKVGIQFDSLLPVNDPLISA